MKAISKFAIWIALAMVAPAGLLAQNGQRRLPEPHENATHGRITITEAAVVRAEKWMAEHREGLEKRQIEERFRQMEEQRHRQIDGHIVVRLTETMRALRKSLQTSVGNSNEHEVKELRDLQTQLEAELKARRTKRPANNRQVDPQRAQIQEFRNSIEKLTDEGHRDEAAKLSERLELYVQRIRKGRERGEPNRQDAIIHELNQHRENLEREFEANSEKLSELGERGGEEAIGHVKRVMQELREELAGVHHRLAEFEGHEAQERREREEHREYEERREHEQRREGGHEEMERRIQHMREAMENLHAAGRPDLAEGIAHEAEQMEREFHERGRHEEDSHGREAVEALHHLGGQIEHVNNQLDRTNDQLTEVANMLRMLVGKLGIHSDHRNNDRGHREHEGHRPDDDRERSGDHRERHDDDDRDHDRGHKHHTDGEHDDHDGDGDDRNRGDDHDHDHDDR